MGLPPVIIHFIFGFTIDHPILGYFHLCPQMAMDMDHELGSLVPGSFAVTSNFFMQVISLRRPGLNLFFVVFSLN